MEPCGWVSDWWGGSQGRDSEGSLRDRSHPLELTTKSGTRVSAIQDSRWAGWGGALSPPVLAPAVPWVVWGQEAGARLLVPWSPPGTGGLQVTHLVIQMQWGPLPASVRPACH